MNEIGQAVQIHQSEIASGFLSSLGKNALMLLFTHVHESDLGVLITARQKNDRNIIGFIIGSTNTNSFYKEFLIKNFLKATVTVLPKILTFQRFQKIFETLFYPLKNDVKKLPKAELLDFAVDSRFQGKGIASLLFEEFINIMKDKSIKTFKIGTGENLYRAQRFYEKVGAHRIGEIEIHKGSKTIIYEYTVN